MRRRLAAGGLLLAVSGLVACGSPEKDLEKARKALLSWTATVEEVGRGWSRGLLPAAFAKTALKACDEEVGRESQKVVKAKNLPGAREALDQAAALRERIARLRDAVERDDRAAGKRAGAQDPPP